VAIEDQLHVARLTGDLEWRRVRRRLLAAARCYKEGNADALAALLAEHVIVRLPGDVSRSLSRSAAGEALVRWRERWRTCEIVVPEMLWSGPLFAATCRVAGVRWDGTPAYVDLALSWSVGPDGVRSVEFVPSP
jgi:hypothetical protein